MLRGAEIGRRYKSPEPEKVWAALDEQRLDPGEIDRVSPTIGDIHQVANAYPDRVSISIHVYGANIGAVSRHVFSPETGAAKPFVSGYSSANIPNFWDRSTEVRAALNK